MTGAGRASRPPPAAVLAVTGVAQRRCSIERAARGAARRARSGRSRTLVRASPRAVAIGARRVVAGDCGCADVQPDAHVGADRDAIGRRGRRFLDARRVPVGYAVYLTHLPGAGAPFTTPTSARRSEPVTLTTAGGLEAARLVRAVAQRRGRRPSIHGTGSNRLGVADHARLLARHGYGVLHLRPATATARAAAAPLSVGRGRSGDGRSTPRLAYLRRRARRCDDRPRSALRRRLAGRRGRRSRPPPHHAASGARPRCSRASRAARPTPRDGAPTRRTLGQRLAPDVARRRASSARLGRARHAAASRSSANRTATACC